jgi:hypothetical protein
MVAHDNVKGAGQVFASFPPRPDLIDPQVGPASQTSISKVVVGDGVAPQVEVFQALLAADGVLM